MKGGLVICVGTDAAESLSNDWDNPACVFQCLETSDAKVSSLRKKIDAAGCSGRVSVSRWDGRSLPHVNSLVNLPVAESGEWQVAGKDTQRVLAPNGVAVINGRRTVKSWPDNIDEWTHCCVRSVKCGADVAALANDRGSHSRRVVSGNAEPLRRRHCRVVNIENDAVQKRTLLCIRWSTIQPGRLRLICEATPTTLGPALNLLQDTGQREFAQLLA